MGAKKHPLLGRKQSAEHIRKRTEAMVAARLRNPWMAGKPASTPEVLWSKVDRKGVNECWLWKGLITELGYGRTWIAGKAYYAHRVIYALQYPGAIALSAPRRKDAWGFLRHTCDNPSCCNPRHLELGTQADNMQDKVKRGRSDIWAAGSVYTPRAKLSSDDVRFIRKAHKDGMYTRQALADRFAVSLTTIKGVLSGRHYVDVS